MSNLGSGHNPSHREDLGYPDEIANHLTQQEAVCVLHTEAREQIRRFIQALKLKNPVSDDVAAALLMDVAKHTLPPGSEEMAIQMRINDWNRYLSEEELQEAARNAHAYLQSREGIELGNFLVKTMAKANDYMWADDQETKER
jgi:phenylalanyl-tRNA synthetase beta subunit